MRPSAAVADPGAGFAAPQARDLRIDLIRGLALGCIFINHIPGQPFERLTSRNFGFSDAAEAFVLLAGVSAALAYSRLVSQPRIWPAVAKIWHRAWTLYLVHILISLTAIALVTGLMRFWGVSELLSGDGFRHLVTDPVGVLIGLPLMLHQFGYINILPLYVVLLLATPLMLKLAARRPGALLAGSVALWGFAGLTYTNLPNWPTDGGWFLNPLSWQLIYVLGLLIGTRLKQGRRLVPVQPLLIGLSLVMVLGAAIWVQVPAVAALGNRTMVWLSQAGLPPLLTNFDKGFLQAPRLLHLLAAAYLVSVTPALSRLAAARWLWPVLVMGRQGLPVFAFGTVLAFAARGVKAVLAPELALAAPYQVFILDSLLVGGGLLLLVGIAALFDASRSAARPTPAAARSLAPATV